MVTILPGANGLIAPMSVDLVLRKERDLAPTLSPWVAELIANLLDRPQRADHAKSKNALSTEDGQTSETLENVANPVEQESRQIPEHAQTLNHNSEEKYALDLQPALEIVKTRNAPLTEDGHHTQATDHAARPADPEHRAEVVPVPTQSHNSEEYRAVGLLPALDLAKTRSAQLTASTLLGEPVQPAAMEDGDLEHVTTQHPNTVEKRVRELPRRGVTLKLAQ